MTRWVRNRPSGRENALAGLVGVGVGAALGAVTFYLTRLLLARDPISPGAELSRVEKGSGADIEESPDGPRAAPRAELRSRFRSELSTAEHPASPGTLPPPGA